jgi:hypothetical protein
MEKMAIVRPDVTPALTDTDKVKAASDCVSPPIVDNCKASVLSLDADFRKKAATQVEKALD